jgi:hypothetical protein
VSRWETTSTLEAGVNPASVWQKAYADAAAWPLPDAQRAIVELAESERPAVFGD